MAKEPSAASLPSDEDMKNAIVSALDDMTVDEVRPNKLRKIVCKRVKGASWTQFQVNLDALIESGRLKAGEDDEGDRVLLLKSSSKEADGVAPAKQNKEKLSTKSVDIPLPRGVALHLIRKSHLKQKNIETNTKTKFRMNGKKLSKKNIADGSGDDELTITVFAVLSPNEGDDGQDSAEEDAAINRKLKAATVMIEQMIKGFKKNPDHFVERTAGGSFKQQAKEKKRRHDAQQHRHDKRTKGTGGKNQSDKKEGENDGSASKKKQRKFY